MMKMTELRGKIKEYIQGKETFTTSEVKEELKEKGYVYNVDYDVTSFSNAISSLTRQNYIASMDAEKKGNYMVVGNRDIKDKEKETYIKKEPYRNEPELKEMREKIRESLKESCAQIEQILDSEKPSKYGRNRKTYDDILRLIKSLKEFEFTIKD